MRDSPGFFYGPNSLRVMNSYSISENLDSLIKSVYSGPLEEPLWYDFLERLRNALDASFATLVLRPPSEGDEGTVLNALLASQEVYSSYNEFWFSLDPFVNLPLGQVVTLREFIPEEELVKTEYYQQYIAPIGVGQIMGVDMADPNGLNARLRVTRHVGQPEFSEQDKAIVASIVPHLEQAIALHSRIARAESERLVFEDAVDQLSVSTFVLDQQANIIRINAAGQRLLDAGKGVSVVEGQLSLGSRKENQRFKDVLEAVLQAQRQSTPGFVKAFRTEESPGVMKLGMLLKPLPLSSASDSAAQPSIAVFVSDPSSRQQVPREILGELFDFTPAEASLALLLANGLTLDEASGELGISRNTAKSHLSAVFAKTGVTRQPKLVQLILKSVAAISPAPGE